MTTRTLYALGLLALWAHAAAPARAQELLRNGSFADSGDGKVATGWRDASQGLQAAPVFSVVREGPDGVAAQKITAAESSSAARAQLAQNLPAPDAGLYRFRVRLKADKPLTVEVQVRLAPRPGTVYGVRRVTLAPGAWTSVSGFALIPALQNDALFAVELRNPGTLLIADASLQPAREDALSPAERRALEAQLGPKLAPVDEAKLLTETDARIRKHRTGPLTVRVVDKAGKPLANQKVAVKHVRHLFKFGSDQLNRVNPPRAGESDVDKRHREAYLRLFNYSTVQFYWGSYEPQRGQYQHEAVLRKIRWLKEQNITPRGHTIFWNIVAPGWLPKSADPSEMRALFDTRMRQLSQTVIPALSDVDVWNELVQWDRVQSPVTDFVNREGKIKTAAHYLKEFKRLNPGVGAVVNDFDSTPAAYDLLKQLLEAGAPIDIIGQQTHGGLGGGPKAFWNLAERLSLLKRPVLFSELSVLSGQKKPDGSWPSTPEGEARQADEAETFYKLAYSHPNAMGVVIWNFSDLGSWRAAPRGFLRKDGTPKPAFDRVDNLINKAWRTGGTFTTDARGTLVVPGAFEGAYEVTSGGARANGEHRAAAPLRLVLRR